MAGQQDWAQADGIEIPLIDISPYFLGDSAAKEALARNIDAACRTIGFLVVSGHGVPERLVKAAGEVARQMFDLPQAVKETHRQSGRPGPHRGYRGMEQTALALSYGSAHGVADYRETYALNRVDIDPADPYYTGAEGRRHFAPKVWSPYIPEFETVLTEYYQAMENLALVLMRLFALALGLEEHWFDDKVDKHISNFSLSNYPDQDRAPKQSQLRAGAHTDWGSLTILKTEDKPGGLEVFSGGVWKPVPVLPGTFIINIGDLMARWTNDRWVSTLHRVVNPPRELAAGSRRQSLVFFHQPNLDALIECIPTCAADAPKYPPVRSGDYLRLRAEQIGRIANPA